MKRHNGLVVSMSALRLGGLGSIPGRVILKTLKIEPNASPLGTQHQRGWIGESKIENLSSVCESAGTKKNNKKLDALKLSNV